MVLVLLCLRRLQGQAFRLLGVPVPLVDDRVGCVCHRNPVHHSVRWLDAGEDLEHLERLVADGAAGDAHERGEELVRAQALIVRAGEGLEDLVEVGAPLLADRSPDLALEGAKLHGSRLPARAREDLREAGNAQGEDALGAVEQGGVLSDAEPRHNGLRPYAERSHPALVHLGAEPPEPRGDHIVHANVRATLRVLLAEQRPHVAKVFGDQLRRQLQLWVGDQLPKRRVLYREDVQISVPQGDPALVLFGVRRDANRLRRRLRHGIPQEVLGLVGHRDDLRRVVQVLEAVDDR
mmetsp:Transcript_126973/g.367550  ORF Transcript_126973/g.367550 Transcript_126973/m.367550 type:complete len:293 (-) Transcript_126973:3697-4575(-)